MPLFVCEDMVKDRDYVRFRIPKVVTAEDEHAALQWAGDVLDERGRYHSWLTMLSEENPNEFHRKMESDEVAKSVAMVSGLLGDL